MTYAIFKPRDRVTLNKKAPKFILSKVSPYVARTIVSLYYNIRGGYNIYFLGYNGRGEDISWYGFRAYMLDIYVPLPKDRTYKRAQTLQSKLQKNMRDDIARTGKPNSR